MMITWLTDKDGNRCSVEYFGSKEAARAALDSLKNCQNCTNCSGCSRCSRCSRCSDCSDCSKVAFCYNRKNLAPVEATADAAGNLGAPLVPVIPDIHKTIYAAVSKPGALDIGSWHTCEKTHCRAGWAVQLAGEAGRKLEEFHNTELAAMLIYGASGFQINPARFYDDNETALEDMKRLAEQQANNG